VTGAIFGLAYAQGAGNGSRTVVITANAGGAAWTPTRRHLVQLARRDGLLAVAFASPQAGWLVGTDGRILKNQLLSLRPRWSRILSRRRAESAGTTGPAPTVRVPPGREIQPSAQPAPSKGNMECDPSSRRAYIAALLVLLAGQSFADQGVPSARPVARVEAVTDTHFRDKVTDPIAGWRTIKTGTG